MSSVMARESFWEFISFAAVVIISSVAGEGDNQLTQTSGCVCIGQDVTFTCSIDGGGNTLYNGTAFNCPSANSASNNQILLRHSGFGTLGEPNGMCNNGAITAEGVRVDGTRYTSRLNVTVSSDIVGMNVSCIYDDALRGMEFLIGNVQIDLTSGDELSRPSNISLVGASPNYLTFKWGSVTHSCSTLLYNITMIGPNCGNCPSIVSSTTTNCSIEPLQPDEVRVCTFRVQGVLCGNVSGPSNEINVTLQVPGVPMIRIIPVYSASERNLLSLQVAIMKSGPFSNVLDGSTYYNINYTNSMSGESCGSAVIPASSCTSSVCNHDFDISSSLCSPSTVLSVSIFASSILGDGRVSEELTFAEINNFVDVSFDAANERFICAFTNEQDTSEKTCGITLYSDCNQQQILSFAQANSTDSQVTVVLDIDGFQSDTSVYCYIAIASNETYTLNLNGSVGQTGASPSSSTRMVAIAVGILVPVALIAIILGVVIGLAIIVRKGHNDSTDGASLDLEAVKDNRFMKLEVKRDCDLKSFIEEQGLTFQSGAAFYEFTRAEEDISFMKEIILMDKETSKLYTGQIACDMIGAPGEGIKKPKLKKYRVFVQSQGIGFRPLKSESLVLYEHTRSRTDTNKSLESKRSPVDSDRFKKFDVTEDCELQEFIQDHCKLPFKPGCAFFEFTEDKEHISEQKKVLFMDKETGEIFTDPGVLSVIGAPGRDIKRPSLDQWRVFIQSMYGARIIREGSILLYDTESQEVEPEQLEEVEPERLKVLDVEKTCSIGDIVKKYQLGPYNPRRFFFEFIRAKEEITDDKEIILMEKDTQKMFTGLKAKKMIGATSKDVRRPTLKKYRVFVQNGGGDTRCLKKGTRLLYEKNYQL